MCEREREHRRARRGRLVDDDQVLELVTARIRVLAEPTRIRLMWLLDESREAATVDELADQLPMTRQNVSTHLVLLHGAGLVDRLRTGKTVRYTLADWTALWVVEQIASSVAERLEEQRRSITGEPASEM